jgi:hypothetical protein
MNPATSTPAPPSSAVGAYLRGAPATSTFLDEVLLGISIDGAALVDDHLMPMIEAIYKEITQAVSASTLTLAQASLYIEELAVFARHNSMFLARSGDTVAGSCFELAHELRRNHLEEGGERGKLPAHYTIYSRALLTDLDIRVNGHVPREETQTLLLLHDLLVSATSASTICGGYFATEGVAIAETVLLRSITDRYGLIVHGASGADLPALDYYYRLHLDDEHEAAAPGLSVEAGHIDGLARFIREADRFDLDLSEVCDGFLQIFEAMVAWWMALVRRADGMEA